MEATPEEANVAVKLFKIFIIVVCNANLNSFELQLEVEDRIIDDKDDPDFLPPESKKFKVSTPSLEQMKKAVDAYDSASIKKIKAARGACLTGAGTCLGYSPHDLKNTKKLKK